MTYASSRQNHTTSWSSEGCRVTFATPGVTSCLCNHTTNFAVLMNYLEPKVHLFLLESMKFIAYLSSGVHLNSRSVAKRFHTSDVTDFSSIFPSVTVESWGRAYSLQADVHRLRSVAVCPRRDLNDVHRLGVSNSHDLYAAGKRTSSSSPALDSRQCWFWPVTDHYRYFYINPLRSVRRRNEENLLLLCSWKMRVLL